MSNYMIKSGTSGASSRVPNETVTTTKEVNTSTVVASRSGTALDSAKTTIAEASKRYGSAAPRVAVKRYAIK